MLNPPNHTKIRPTHLERHAFIYVRQSTLMQVREHTASTARQYPGTARQGRCDLTQRAHDLGWAPEHITVIDQDQGQSGASTIGRDGFQTLLLEVSLGHAGAVLSLEVSRLARSCSDWYRLIEICAVTDTLVVDEEGIYDPGQYNDRLLLGFKGTMSEAELHWLRSRLLGGKLEKAQHGQLHMRLPVGLIYDPAGQIVLDPDEEIQHAVQMVFDQFQQSGSAMMAVKYFAQHQLLVPNRLWGGVHDGEVLWEPLQRNRVLSMLHNPAYAGTYVYGRTQTRRHSLPGEAPRVKGHTHWIPRENWPIVLPRAHPGYISWEQFLHNQAQIDDNRTFRAEQRRGAVREGAALLQGIVLCGRCGRRMSVRYPNDGTSLTYVCGRVHSERGGTLCQSIQGQGVEGAVIGALFDALQPAQLQISLATLAELEAQARQVERQWALRLERAHYEVDLARQRYLAVDPENRLVARSLEREWNTKLAEGERLEHEQANQLSCTRPPLEAADRQRILALAQDVPTIWNAPTTTAADHKRLLRCLIQEVTLTKRDTTIDVIIRWQSEACTPLTTPRPLPPADVYRTSAAVIERVRALAVNHTDRQMADRLNAEGLTPGQGGLFVATKVKWIRRTYGISSGCAEKPIATADGPRGDGRYSARVAAQLLNVHIATVVAWCKAGRLEGIQTVAHGPWWVTLTADLIAQLRKPSRQRRQAPRSRRPESTYTKSVTTIR